MVRSPPVMSPSSAAQMDSKLPNQGKPGGAGSQSQPSPCDPKILGPKGPVGSLGLKNGQGLNAGNGAKGKMKRERSTSVESFEHRDTGTSNNEGDQKGKAEPSPTTSDGAIDRFSLSSQGNDQHPLAPTVSLHHNSLMGPDSVQICTCCSYCHVGHFLQNLKADYWPLVEMTVHTK